MRWIGAALAVAGLALAVALFARENVGALVALVMASSPGLLLAAVFHITPMAANALAWQRLLPPGQRPRVSVLTWATWVRESVNALLPVARIGGEIVAYRIVRRHVTHRIEAAASLVADMSLSVVSQAGFALVGLTLLFANGYATDATKQLLAGISTMIPLGVGFMFAQRAGALGVVTRIVGRLFVGRLRLVQMQSLRLDQALRAIYRRSTDVGSCFAWQLAGWVLGAGEIWLAMYFLGQQPSVVDALVIEALVQAVSSAVFFVPGALGVQEGAFVLVGSALGLDSATALALATARRLRDVVIFFPGLVAWQWGEMRIRGGRASGASSLR